MSITDMQEVLSYRKVIEAHIVRLVSSRLGAGIERPVSESDCILLLQELKEIKDTSESSDQTSGHYAALETVFREAFVAQIASTPIDDPSFSNVWALLDIANILSDKDLCEHGLGFWLVEELLDSQTIDGCRKVFDYLESRRERMTAENFSHKSLAILRCCNELLRRLSRAEDTVFCGRVFIFLFQSFPLGDKSSVNLRGEFHVENVTTFDPIPKKSEDAIKPMEIDTDLPQNVQSGSGTPSSFAADPDRSQTSGRETPAGRKAIAKSKEPVDLDTLYPIFWSLQSIFSNPTRLFTQTELATFKDGIAATMSCFQRMGGASASTTRPDETRRGTKRKRSDIGSQTSTFNPKYLTNRDLFDLEVQDIAFRRHILVQTLIIIDFLLSLTPTAQAKLTGLNNKSVLYAYTLSTEDAKWATSTRATIAEYLQTQAPGNEGRFYFRMVDTVLSRDKNWVRWKAENCPSISRPPVDAKTQVEARQNLQKLCSKQPLTLPPGAADLDFLSQNQSLESLKRKNQDQIPSMEEFYNGIMNDELDAEMGTQEEMDAAKEQAQGKLWRALRASGRRFHLCEKIEAGKNLKALLGDVEESKEDAGGGGGGRGEEEQVAGEDEDEGVGAADVVEVGSPMKDESSPKEETPEAPASVEVVMET